MKTTIDGKTYTGATITSGYLSKSGSVSISIKVTDSRGRTASASRTITVIAYSQPKIGEFKAFRSLSDGTENYEGEHLYLKYNYTIAVINNLNDSFYRIEYRQNGASSWTELYSGASYNLASSNITEALFSVDNAYEVRMTVSDYFSSDSTTVDIPTAFTLMDLKANGRGIAFGKVSEKDGFEVGIPAYFSYGEVPSSAVVLNPDQDLDNIRTSGFYTFSSATRTTLLNMPVDTGSGAVIVLDMGEAGQKMQIAVKCSVNSEIWERMYYSSTWYAWKKVYNGKGKILWSGSYYMTENQTATLSEKVSEQSSGIVLVFSRYVDGVAQNYGFNSFFVSKMLVSEQDGKGNVFTLNSSAIFGVMAAKYLYIHDDSITGNESNNASGTASSGITYNNAGFVLRYVIGV